MIEVETTEALLLYLAFFLLLCLGAWLFNHLKNRKQERLPPPYLLTTCEFCHYAYLAKNGQKITKCPQCESFNSSSI